MVNVEHFMAVGRITASVQVLDSHTILVNPLSIHHPGFFPPLYRCTRINEPLGLPTLNGLHPHLTEDRFTYLLPNHLDAVSMEVSYSIGSEAGRSLRNRDHHSLYC